VWAPAKVSQRGSEMNSTRSSGTSCRIVWKDSFRTSLTLNTRNDHASCTQGRSEACAVLKRMHQTSSANRLQVITPKVHSLLPLCPPLVSCGQRVPTSRFARSVLVVTAHSDPGLARAGGCALTQVMPPVTRGCSMLVTLTVRRCSLRTDRLVLSKKAI
jgi:hypothetical protein